MLPPSPLLTLHVLIEGRVQGVWFRGWTMREAQALGLQGWVRNRLDGRVEAVFHGPADRVAAMTQACHRGPPSARVVAVITAPWPDRIEPGFHQRPTA